MKEKLLQRKKNCFKLDALIAEGDSVQMSQGKSVFLTCSRFIGVV